MQSKYGAGFVAGLEIDGQAGLVWINSEYCELAEDVDKTPVQRWIDSVSTLPHYAKHCENVSEDVAIYDGDVELAVEIVKAAFGA